MPRFFIRKEQIEDKRITLTGDDAHHVARSLRMAVGEEITVCDMQGNEYSCTISGFDADREVYADITDMRRADNEPPCRIRLFQALSKGDKLDTVIQKAVECGVYEIIPFESERCIVRLKDEAEQRKTERRNKIAAEAAKQCGRGILPTVSPTVTFEKALELANASELRLFCYEGDGTLPLGKVLDEHLSPRSDGSVADISVIIGSEGGFSQAEANAAVSAGMIPIGLGKRILRTETAPIFALSCIILKCELS
ncbi:MAG: 16S rRNA (uracil(1498)-N(3))-methyltransferase [Clostridia bacterium]|nr:16S rRNA (uracil(1498)-N(3))-methyltransferase [Clostridia bacterium]